MVKGIERHISRIIVHVNPILVVLRHSIFQPNKIYDQSDILSLHFHSYTFLHSEFSSKNPL